MLHPTKALLLPPQAQSLLLRADPRERRCLGAEDTWHGQSGEGRTRCALRTCSRLVLMAHDAGRTRAPERPVQTNRPKRPVQANGPKQQLRLAYEDSRNGLMSSMLDFHTRPVERHAVELVCSLNATRSLVHRVPAAVDGQYRPAWTCFRTMAPPKRRSCLAKASC